MIYQFEFEHGEIEYCSECPMNNCTNDSCGFSGEYTKYKSTPKENNCPLVAISKAETTSCEWCDNADEMEVSVKTVFDSGKCVGIKRFLTTKAHYCTNCGRRLEEKI